MRLQLTSTPGWWRPGLTEFVDEGVRNTANKVKYSVHLFTAQKTNKCSNKVNQKYFENKKKSTRGLSTMNSTIRWYLTDRYDGDLEMGE